MTEPGDLGFWLFVSGLATILLFALHQMWTLLVVPISGGNWLSLIVFVAFVMTLIGPVLMELDKPHF